MEQKSLEDYIRKEGIEGKIFHGAVGGKKREYTPLGIHLIYLPRPNGHVYLTSPRIFLKERWDNFKVSIFIRLIGNDIPKRIIKENRF